jgi:hypothetical protein
VSKILKELLPALNLPRVNSPLKDQGKRDYEQVGFGAERSAAEHGWSAVNNGIAVFEDLAKAVASPFVGVGLGVQAAVTGEGLGFGPGIPERLVIGGRAGPLMGAVGLGLAGCPIYIAQLSADLVQSGAEGVTAAALGVSTLVKKGE